MQKSVITVAYHSLGTHTEQAAKLLAEFLHSNSATVHVIDVKNIHEHWAELNNADAIVFGSPTSFGTVSAGFKEFMEQTDSFWYKQPWKNKLAAGFTVSSCTSGDKLNTLQTLSLFAMQHGMLWISLGVLPRFIGRGQTDGQNRFASYSGLMIQSICNEDPNLPFHPGDLLTLELFAKRILEITIKQTHLIK